MFPKSWLINLIFLITVCLGSISVGAQPNETKPTAVDPNDIDFVRVQFRKHESRLPGMMWSLTHNYSDKSEVDKVLEDLIGFFTALQTSDPEALKKLGGLEGIKNKFASYTKSGDSTVRGFSAIILGIFGDKKYVPAIAEILSADFKFKDDLPRMTETSKGQAAIALSMLGAAEYEGKVLELLKTGNDFNRSGAITALIGLGGKKHAQAVVDLMLDKKAYGVDKIAPIHFLLETGAALDYKKELIDLLHLSFNSEQQEAIIFLFVSLDAKETKREIAKLLTVDYVKGDAAKGLAMMGAKEYEDQIALLLNDESSLVRSDAIVALGILDAKKYAPKIAAMMTNDPKDFGAVNAAEAILLMGAKTYFPKAREIIGFKIDKRPFPYAGDFHPFVAAKVDVIRKKLEEIIDSTTPQKLP